ncbi:NAD(P)H-binding protein [Holzapfeliella floricola]|uniref:NAD(P)-binding domain-containing protein n=1 Tax=Holzapfeliella floricola DSM 23037 = JCM 16512 TaxID=1423744 RepID=A0A0R2DKI4_9LACO|nr:NAD(P)H-binding protein [Holzapfeliella floricola]KRN04639.1 hypothetical protein FC86_GL000087 [Holzapfeliella floricola DSM 23037 = JCM 16512]
MNVLILGAHGQIAQIVRKRLLVETDAHLTLYLRQAKRIKPINDKRETVIEADVNDYQALVYANLGGVFEPMVKNILQAMSKNTVNRLIHVTGLGLYHEVPEPFGSWVENSVGHEVMADTRRAAQLIEDSAVNATIIRAAYMSNADEIDYQLTQKGETYQGTTISRASIADLITKIVKNPELHSFSSLGISQPGTDGKTPIYR